MKILIDMNLSPKWCEVLARHGHEAIHWSTIGESHANDIEIMHWAAVNEYVVFSHDLDFGALLVATQAHKPSVIQFRTENILPDYLETHVVAMLQEYMSQIENGALIVVEEWRNRVRILPLERKK